jgi:hypothetical protein
MSKKIAPEPYDTSAATTVFLRSRSELPPIPGIERRKDQESI